MKLKLNDIKITGKKSNIIIIVNNLDADHNITVDNENLLSISVENNNITQLFRHDSKVILTADETSEEANFNYSENRLTLTLSEFELEGYNSIDIEINLNNREARLDEPITETYLVDVDYIREQTNLSSNISDKFLNSAIRETVDIDARELLGTKLLGKIKFMIQDDSIYDVDNEAYYHLVVKMQQFLSYKVIENILPICAAKIGNLGVITTKDEQTESLSMKEIFTLQEYYNSKASYYKLLIQQYIIKNIDCFTELDDCDINVIQADLDNFSDCPIALGGKHGYDKDKNKIYHRHRRW